MRAGAADPQRAFRDELATGLAEAARRARQLVAGLDEAALHWAPDGDTWSLADILEHLVLTLAAWGRALDGALNAPGGTRVSGPRGPVRSGRLAGAYLDNLRPEKGLSFPAPRALRPPSRPAPEGLARLLSELQGFERRLAALATRDANAPRLRSPTRRWLSFSAGEALLVQLAHVQRHLGQGAALRAHPAFPGGARTLDGFPPAAGRLARATESRRLARARVVTALGLVAGLLLSQPLWRCARPFPLVPVSLGPLLALGALPAPLDLLPYVALLGAVALTLARRWAAAAGTVAVLLAAGLVLQDQMRLQPWVYQDLLVLALAGLAVARPGAAPRAAGCLRLLLAATYLWSGLHKIHGHFVADGWPWLLSPLAVLLPEGAARVVSAGGWVAGPFEAALGIALLTRRLRRFGVAGVLSLHAVILALVGPWGHDWNAVVWPWNLMMMALVPCAFLGCGAGITETLRPGGRLGAAATLLFLLAPAGNPLGLWDSYASFCLYSYSAPAATFSLSEEAVARLDATARAAVVIDEAGRRRLDADRWSLAALGVPVYPERRVFHRLHAHLCAEVGRAPDDVTMVLLTRQRWPATGTVEAWPCGAQRPSTTGILR